MIEARSYLSYYLVVRLSLSSTTILSGQIIVRIGRLDGGEINLHDLPGGMPYVSTCTYTGPYTTTTSTHFAMRRPPLAASLRCCFYGTLAI